MSVILISIKFTEGFQFNQFLFFATRVVLSSLLLKQHHLLNFFCFSVFSCEILYNFLFLLDSIMYFFFLIMSVILLCHWSFYQELAWFFISKIVNQSTQKSKYLSIAIHQSWSHVIFFRIIPLTNTMFFTEKYQIQFIPQK